MFLHLTYFKSPHASGSQSLFIHISNKDPHPPPSPHDIPSNPMVPWCPVFPQLRVISELCDLPRGSRGQEPLEQALRAGGRGGVDASRLLGFGQLHQGQRGFHAHARRVLVTCAAEW